MVALKELKEAQTALPTFTGYNSFVRKRTQCRTTSGGVLDHLVQRRSMTERLAWDSQASFGLMLYLCPQYGILYISFCSNVGKKGGGVLGGGGVFLLRCVGTVEELGEGGKPRLFGKFVGVRECKAKKMSGVFTNLKFCFHAMQYFLRERTAQI